MENESENRKMDYFETLTSQELSDMAQTLHQAISFCSREDSRKIVTDLYDRVQILRAVRAMKHHYD